MAEQGVGQRRLAVAVVTGQIIEYYDFFLYGSAAALVFGPAFFPTSDPRASTAAAFATFAAGFVMRPLGAVVFGHLGDRVGRRRTLVLTLAIMGTATTVIGFLPTYADAGLVAPVSLVVLRCLQGLSMGGEWGGAVLLALEHAPRGRSTTWGALPQLGSPIGFLLSTGALLAVAQLPGDAFESWAWRVPFIATSALLVLGVWARRHLLESPHFLRADTRRVSFPLLAVLRGHGRVVVGGVLLAALPTGGYYLVTTFISFYVVDELGLSRETALVGQLLSAAVQMALVPIVASMATGRDPRRVVLGAATAAALWAFPFYGLVHTRVPVAVWAGQASAMVALTVVWALLPAIVGPRFPAGVRYTGVSLALQGASVVGGFAPVVATGLLAASDGGMWGVAGLLTMVAATSAVGAVLLRDPAASRRSTPIPAILPARTAGLREQSGGSTEPDRSPS